MEIKFIEKAQIYQDETTHYWFDVDGESYAVSDCNGERCILDSDGAPIDLRHVGGTGVQGPDIEIYDALYASVTTLVNLTRFFPTYDAPYASVTSELEAD